MAGEVKPVSILVVVDLGQRHSLDELPNASVSRFNPCCRGSRSTAAEDARRLSLASGSFNPCCRGSWSTARCGCGLRTAVGRTGFNPCCRGSRSTAPRQVTSFGRHTQVSILVVVDLGQRPLTPGAAGSTGEWFQSLLLWISVNGFRFRDRHSRHAPKSFNPCCRGSRSTAGPERTVLALRDSFNPCCRGSRSTASGHLSLVR